MPEKTPPADPDAGKIAERLADVKHKVIVLSGKGGVGKSTVAVNVATALCLAGKKVGLLDVDFHGPTVPAMTGTADCQPVTDPDAGLLPVTADWGLKVISIRFFLPDPDAALIWRGPMKMNAIKQFLRDVAWGSLDYLLVDCPPGTGDEPLSVAQLLGSPTHALVVTTPQQVATDAVRRSITFCRSLGLNLLGVVENMSSFLCPHCGRRTPLLAAGGGRRMAEHAQVDLLAEIPFSPDVCTAGDTGRPVALDPKHPVGAIYTALAGEVVTRTDAPEPHRATVSGH